MPITIKDWINSHPTRQQTLQLTYEKDFVRLTLVDYTNHNIVTATKHLSSGYTDDELSKALVMVGEAVENELPNLGTAHYSRIDKQC